MDDLIERLRAATEDDIEAALKDASFGPALDTIDPAVLLELHNRMLDRVLGEEPSGHGVALLGEPETRH